MLKIFKGHISVGKTFRTSPHIIWDVITDTAQWPRWGPTVKAVRASERYIHKASEGQILTAFGWLPFIITEYEHECFWNWKVASVRATGHRLESTDAGGVVLWLELPLIAFPYLAICQIALNRIPDCVAKIKK